MSTNHDEFISEWNEMFPFNINVNYLTTPTEQFLLRALECYLQNINIDVDAVRQDLSNVI